MPKNILNGTVSRQFPSSSVGRETGLVSRLARGSPSPAAVQRAKQPGASRRRQEGEAHRYAYSIRCFARVPRPQGARRSRHPAGAPSPESSFRRRRCQKSRPRGNGQQENGGGVYGGRGGGGRGGGVLEWSRHQHPAGRGERDGIATGMCPYFLPLYGMT